MIPPEASKVIEAARALQLAHVAALPLREKVHAVPLGKIEKGSENDRLIDEWDTAEQVCRNRLAGLLEVTAEYEVYMSKPEEGE